jgi:hypothetical protein
LEKMRETAQHRGNEPGRNANPHGEKDEAGFARSKDASREVKERRRPQQALIHGAKWCPPDLQAQLK